jgi:hypothetical protein
MMRADLRLVVAACGLAACLWGGSARAQGLYRPPVSPYLNLVRPGNPGLNYYNLVRPQVEFGNSILGLQQQVGALGTEVALEGQAQTALPTTGHATVFGNYSHYYPGLTAPGAAPGQAPVRGARPLR